MSSKSVHLVHLVIKKTQRQDLTKSGFAAITDTHVEIEVIHHSMHRVDRTGHRNHECVLDSSVPQITHSAN